MSSFESNEPGTGVSRRTVECAFAVLLCLFAVAVLWDSYGRGAGWKGGPQSGFFPARLAWLLLAASVVVFFQGLRSDNSVFATWSQLRQVSIVMLALAAYVLAISYIGIYVASAAFLGSFMVAFGSFRWWSVVAASVLIPLVTFWVFEMQFGVPLPKGPLEAMLGF